MENFSISQNDQNTLARMMQDQLNKAAATTKKVAAPKQAPKKPFSPDNLPNTYNSLEKVTQAAKSGQMISLLNLSNLVSGQNKPQQTQPEIDREIDNVDISELTMKLETPIFKLESEPIEESAAPRLEIVPYTPNSFLVIGMDTKTYKEELKVLGGIYRSNWKGYGHGWMFSNRRKQEVETFIENI